MKKFLSLMVLVSMVICMLGTASVFAAEEVQGVYKTVFIDDFTESTVGNWAVDSGTKTFEDGVLKVTNTTTTYLDFYPTGLKLKSGTKYRISYRTKSNLQSYFLIYKFNTSGNTVKTSVGGAYAGEIYDHTVEGGRGTARNYVNGVETSDWVDVVYEITFYGIQNSSSAAVSSANLDRLRFQLNGSPDFCIDNLKIEEYVTEPQWKNYCSTVFSDNFDSQGSWNVTAGTISAGDSVLSVSNTASTNLEIYPSGVNFKSGSKYRVSYRTKINKQSYFLVFKFNSGGNGYHVIDTVGGNYTGELYDHTLNGGREFAQNYVNGVKTSDWVDVSYEFTIHGIKDLATGALVDSAPIYCLRFMFTSGSPEFSIDNLVIEEIVDNVEFLYDEAMGSVTFDGRTMSNGQKISAKSGTVSVSANDGYYFKEIVVTDKSGNKQTYPTAGSLVFDSDSTVSVVFGKDSAQITKSDADVYENNNSIIVFAGINTAGKTVSECGIDLKNGVDSFRLKADSAKGLSATNEFGIRAFGTWFVPGDYQVKAYAVIDGEEVTEDWTTVTIAEEE